MKQILKDTCLFVIAYHTVAYTYITHTDKCGIFTESHTEHNDSDGTCIASSHYQQSIAHSICIYSYINIQPMLGVAFKNVIIYKI